MPNSRSEAWNRNRSVLLLSALLIFSGQSGFSQNEAGQALEQLDWMLGIWEAESVPGAEQQRSRVRCQKGLNGNLITCKTHLLGPDEEQLIYETMFGWHPLEKNILYLSFGTWNVFYEGQVQVDGKRIEMAWESHSNQGTTRYRQELNLRSPDHYTWKVFQWKDEEWQQIHDGGYRRVQPPGNPSVPEF